MLRSDLSWYEIYILHRDRHYDPELDKESKIDELRILYESSLIAREDATGESDDGERFAPQPPQGFETNNYATVDHAFVSADVASYFASEGLEKRIRTQTQKERALHREAPEVSLSAH